jgi:hypothetical protein
MGPEERSEEKINGTRKEKIGGKVQKR